MIDLTVLSNLEDLESKMIAWCDNYLTKHRYNSDIKIAEAEREHFTIVGQGRGNDRTFCVINIVVVYDEDSDTEYVQATINGDYRKSWAVPDFVGFGGWAEV